VAEKDPCDICSSPQREREVLAVVESPLDVLALEKAGFKGLYHVLHGVIDPLNNIGPEELRIKELLKRIEAGNLNLEAGKEGRSWKLDDSSIKHPASFQVSSIHPQASFSEVILATNPSVEGEATAAYIANKVRELKTQTSNLKSPIKTTRLARGLPVGGDLEYADDVTLGKALEGRTAY
jgi:recombination protein RecR